MTAVLHTWNQKLLFHPHIHFIVPGAGLDAHGKMCRVKNANFLVHRPVLQAAFKQAFYNELKKREWQVDPAVWRKDWGINIQACGSGASAIKYLGAYVARTAIGDSRIVEIDDTHVTFRWKDREDGGRQKLEKLEGVEFTKRYLRHVLPPKMHSVRHYGFCHPAAKKNLERVRFLTGIPLIIQADAPSQDSRPKSGWMCPCCGKRMLLVAMHPRSKRASPAPAPALTNSS
jgi:hypothetical protein